MTPTPQKPLRRYQIIVALVTLAVIAFLYSSHTNWYYSIGPLHHIDLGYPFADMQARLGIAEAINHGIDVIHEKNPFTPSGALNNKPMYTVSIMALLSLKTSHSLILGILFGAAYCGWAFWLLRPSNWKQTIIALLVLVSPPSLLLVERSNDDIIIFTFLMTVPLLLETTKIRGSVIAWLVISLLTPMKYYPAAAYALFLHRSRSLKELSIYVTASSIFIAALLWLTRDEIRLLAERLPNPTINCSFGKKILFDCLGLSEPERTVAYMIGVTLVSALALLFFISKNIKKTVTTQPREELYYLIGSSVAAFCFLMSSNWDYRMAFLIPTLPLTFTLLSESTKLTRYLAVTYLSSMLLTLWPEYLYFTTLIQERQQTWDIDMTPYTKIVILKNAASWVMITVNVLIASLILKDKVTLFCGEALKLIKPTSTTVNNDHK